MFNSKLLVYQRVSLVHWLSGEMGRIPPSPSTAMEHPTSKTAL